MGSSYDLSKDSAFGLSGQKNPSPRQKLLARRFFYALLCAILIHILFFFLSPYLEIIHRISQPTEVSQISSEDLKKIKKNLAKNKQLPALLEQELREKFKSKEPPKNAKFIGKFNQSVPEETVAGATRDAPEISKGANVGNFTKGDARTSNQAKEKKLVLSDIGLKYKLPKPVVEPKRASQGTTVGVNTPYRPVGRADKDLKQGDDNLLNAVENAYYSFFSRFEEPIIRNWYFNLRARESQLHIEMAKRGYEAGAEIPCTIEFTINKAGDFVSIRVAESSGVPLLDETTRQAVVKLGNIPNPPAGIFEGKDTFTYHLRFMVVLQNTPSLSRPGLNWY